MRDLTPKVVKGEVEVALEGVNLINGTRIGHMHRENAIHHIRDVNERGYITDAEAEARIKAAQYAEKQSDINTLTKDLPAPFHKGSVWERYDWDDTVCWVPTLVGGMGLSAVLAVLPTAMLAQDHLFPHNSGALTVGVITIILGIIGFFSCLGGIIAKAG